MRTFRRTLCFHGFAGTPEGSIRALFEDLATVMGQRAIFGDVSFPELPFSRQVGADFADGPENRIQRLHAALVLLWDLEDTLCIGLSMGGLMAALLSQHRRNGTVIALTAPDGLEGGPTLDPTIPVDLLAVYSSEDDAVIRGRTGRWAALTPHTYDIQGITHDHDHHRGTFILAISAFLRENIPCQMHELLHESEDPDFPLHFP